MVVVVSFVTAVWSSYGHTFMNDGDGEDEWGYTRESCLTCGAMYQLKADADGYGVYSASNGDEPDLCSGRTDLVHGYERVCQGDNGRGCEADRESGVCEHTGHECNCVACG